MTIEIRNMFIVIDESILSLLDMLDIFNIFDLFFNYCLSLIMIKALFARTLDKIVKFIILFYSSI